MKTNSSKFYFSLDLLSMEHSDINIVGVSPTGVGNADKRSVSSFSLYLE